MKKIVTLLVFLGCFFNQSQAQGDIRFGFQVSPGVSWMTVVEENTINNNGSNFGLRLGVLGEYYFRENYAVWAGLGFAFGQGGQLEFEEGGRAWPNSEIPVAVPNQPDGTFPIGTDLSYNLQYIEIPFGLKLKTKEFGYLQYFAEIPTFSFGIRSQSRGELEADDALLTDPDIENDDYIIKEEVNPLTVSIGAGLGAEYNISSSTAIIAGLFYRRTVTDVLKDNSAIDAKANMNNITLRFAVMF